MKALQRKKGIANCKDEEKEEEEDEKKEYKTKQKIPKHALTSIEMFIAHQSLRCLNSTQFL